jgi:hypothetical protein
MVCMVRIVGGLVIFRPIGGKGVWKCCARGGLLSDKESGVQRTESPTNHYSREHNDGKNGRGCEQTHD